MADDYPSLMAAVTEYLGTLSVDRRQETQGELGRFLRWCGRERNLRELRPSEVEEYVQRVAAESVVGASDRLAQLKGFLSYASKKNLSGQNLASHVKLRGGRARHLRKNSSRETPQAVQITVEGHRRLLEELEALQQDRTHLAQEIKRAAADKDVRENAPLEAAREQQGHVQARILTLEATLRSVVVDDGKAGPGKGGEKQRVSLGSKVVLQELETGREVNYLLVNPQEADLLGGRLSVASPVGQAVLDRFPGDEVEVSAPRGKIRYRITGITG